METINLILNIVLIILLIIILILLLKNNKTNNTLTSNDYKELNKIISESIKDSFDRFDDKLKNQTELIESKNNTSFEKINLLVNNLEKEIIEMQSDYQKTRDLLNDRLALLNKTNYESNEKIKDRLSLEIKEFNVQVKETLKEFSVSIKELKNEVSKNLDDIRKDNNTQLEKINLTVNEKLEKTLEGKLKQSFDTVVEQIGGVNKAIGEIKGIASDVGSLKTVLTNAKTKGIVGEVILGNIIREILTTSQYEENKVTKLGSKDPVEFVVKMPINEDEYTLLPIDSKLPLESYHKIKDAMETGDKELLKSSRKQLRDAIKKYANDIKQKYIDTPNTTDFAVMFLPIEGLYIEALDMGLFEEVYRDHKIYLAGPTTLSAILNALQLSFKSLAIQKKSTDVFKLLEAVKFEFGKFAECLKKTQTKISSANKELDELVGTRTRAMQRKLSKIQDIDQNEAVEILGFDEEEIE